MDHPEPMRSEHDRGTSRPGLRRTGKVFAAVAALSLALLGYLASSHSSQLVVPKHFIASLILSGAFFLSAFHAVVFLLGTLPKRVVDVMEYAYYFAGIAGIILFSAAVAADRNAYLLPYYETRSQRELTPSHQEPLRAASENPALAQPLCHWYLATLNALRTPGVADDRKALENLNPDWGYGVWMGNKWHDSNHDLRTGAPIPNQFHQGIEELEELLHSRIAVVELKGDLGNKDAQSVRRGLRALLWPFVAILAFSIKLTKVTVSAWGMIR